MISKIKVHIKFKDFIILTIKYIIILYTIYWSVLNIYRYLNLRKEYSDLNHFKYVYIESYLENRIKNLDAFIQKNDNVIILDSSAAVYMIPLNKYNKDYDMFNIGNFGKDGETRLIKEIEEARNTKYLILKKEFNKNWQSPIEIISYVRENKRKVGEIEIFDIYQ